MSYKTCHVASFYEPLQKVINYCPRIKIGPGVRSSPQVGLYREIFETCTGLYSENFKYLVLNDMI